MSKLKTVAIIGLVVLVLVGIADAYLSSGAVHRRIAQYTGYSTICVDGVKYIQFTSGASVQYDANGKVVTCR